MSLAFRARGTSLLELVICMALLAFLLMVGAGIGHWVQRSFGWMWTQSTLQQQLMVIVDRCESDLRQTNPTGLSLAPDLVGLNRLDPLLYQGLRAYEDQLVIYRMEGSSLFRELYPHPKTDWKKDEANRVSPTELNQIVLTAPAQRIRLSQSVVHFNLSPDPSPLIRLELQLEGHQPGRSQPIRCSSERWFYLRNKQ